MLGEYFRPSDELTLVPGLAQLQTRISIGSACVGQISKVASSHRGIDVCDCSHDYDWMSAHHKSCRLIAMGLAVVIILVMTIDMEAA